MGLSDMEVTVKGGQPYTQNAAVVHKDYALYAVAKRLADVFLSLGGLIFLTPLILIVSILIKVEDPKGAVFFKQIRVGKDGKPFKMYKFRSMVHNAEELLAGLLEQNEVSGAMFKLKNDPRVTKIGRFIRKTSIDELPQLLNVLKGEMSLVGPRPASLYRKAEFDLRFQNYREDDVGAAWLQRCFLIVPREDFEWN
jgi:lipopolysaccharide/colanic/teichoic acid biosynthesis glycosyltransferase